MADVPLYVVSDYAASERRITPSWSIWQLKTKLEHITGIPPSSQKISLKTSAGEKIPIEAVDEESVYLQQFPLTPYAELLVSEPRPHFHFIFKRPAIFVRFKASRALHISLSLLPFHSPCNFFPSLDSRAAH